VEFVAITTAYSYAWEYNSHWWVFVYLLEKIDIDYLAALLILEVAICWSLAEVLYQKRWNSFLKGVTKVIIFAVYVLDPNDISFSQDTLVGMFILYFTIKFQILEWIWIEKWTTVIQQPILKINKHCVKGYISILAKYQSTDIVFPVLFN
jgi:hypothetical protein